MGELAAAVQPEDIVSDLPLGLHWPWKILSARGSREMWTSGGVRANPEVTQGERG
jgi:hypothetical protein